MNVSNERNVSNSSINIKRRPAIIYEGMNDMLYIMAVLNFPNKTVLLNDHPVKRFKLPHK